MSTKAPSNSSFDRFNRSGNMRMNQRTYMKQKLEGDDSIATIIFTALTWFIVLGGPLLIMDAKVGPKQKMMWLFVWPLFLSVWMSGIFMGFRFDIEPFTIAISFFMGAGLFLIFSMAKSDEQMAKDITQGNMILWAATYAFLILCADLGRKFYNKSVTKSLRYVSG